jgi:hypothetical protein
MPCPVSCAPALGAASNKEVPIAVESSLNAFRIVIAPFLVGIDRTRPQDVSRSPMRIARRKAAAAMKNA